MEPIKKGKTKDVYKLENGNYFLIFKDSVTGQPDGEMDPGGNSVIGEREGMGLACLKMTAALYKEVEARKLSATHMVAVDFDKKSMEVRPAQPFGEGLEIVVRFIATGSFVRRYGLYVKDGQKFSAPLVEITLKDDQRGDPLINEDALVELGLATAAEIGEIKKRARGVALLVEELAAKAGLTVYDLKMEFGRAADGDLLLIDEISPGSMRAFAGAKRVEGPALSQAFLTAF